MTTNLRVLFALILFFFSSQAFAQLKSGRVILIGIDGMSTEGFQVANLPNIYGLIQQGALSMKTRGVMPTVSAPNWSTITMGAGPEQTGITKNGWTIKNHTITATVMDKEGYFPSIFTLIRQQNPKAKTAFFYDWDALADLYNLKNINKVEFSDLQEKTFEKAIPYILDERPDFVFLYIGFPDEMGHEYGHGTTEYISALQAVDTQIGRLINKLKMNGLLDVYDIMVVTDHGMVGKNHGGESMIELEVPWLICGPGVIRNKMIDQPNDLMNTSPTILYILGLKQPDEWIGRPVYGAFAGTEQSKANTRTFVPRPIPSLKSGIYLEKQDLRFTSNLDGATIRYSLTGKRPDAKAPVYKNPVPLTKTTDVIAVATLNGNESEETVFNFIKIDGIKAVVMNQEMSDRYPGNGPLSLVDGVMGASDFHDPSWIGFHGNNLDVVIDFGSERKIKKLALDCFSKESAWIFLPQSVEFYKSNDGKEFILVTQGKEKNIAGAKNDGSHLFSADFPEIKTRYLRVIGTNIGICPPGHPGKGEKAWLFVDEVVVK